MKPEDLVTNSLPLMQKDEAAQAVVRLYKGTCCITDEEGFPYGDKARGYDPDLAELVAQSLRNQGIKARVVQEHESFQRSPMMEMVEEYQRMVGVGPSLLEKAAGSDRAMLNLLAKAFPVKKVTKADVPFIRYRVFRNSVEMEDQQNRLGDVLTSLEKKEVDPKVLVAWLKKHGAKKM